MKTGKLAIITFIILMINMFILSACPPFDEEDEGSASKNKGKLLTITKSVNLNYEEWIKILIEIDSQSKYVNLDLSECTLDSINIEGGLFEPGISDPLAGYIVFDPLPSFDTGKSKIVSITLPNAATMINSTIDNDKSAFKYFTNLDTVIALNVVRIGNYAFTGCKTLKDVNLPRVGHDVSVSELGDSSNLAGNGFRVDIGDYAFKGCTALEEIKFNAAAVVGSSAFEDCTNLVRINMPKVWFLAEKSFKGCTKLVEVRFESATKIGMESFSGCTSLKNAYFDAKPAIVGPYSDAIAVLGGGTPCGYDSVIFYASAFSGCKALEKLDIRNAWNVFFSSNALFNIGTSLEIYLYDNITNAFGHPQKESFLGDASAGNKPSVNRITLFAPKAPPNIDASNSANKNIAYYIDSTYSISLTIKSF